MRIYRCYLKNPQGRIAKVEEIEAASDADAKARTLDLLRAHFHGQAELWDRGRLVATVAVGNPYQEPMRPGARHGAGGDS